MAGLVVGVAFAAGIGFGGAATDGTGATSSSPAQPPLVGTWRRLTTCAELVSALEKKGLDRFVLEFVAGNGFIPGVTRPEQIANRARPCEGAVARRHSHFFTRSRRFGSLDWRGRPVDDGTYRLLGTRTVVIFKEFPKVTFRYRIRGRTITFTPLLERGCRTFRCAWAISMAYPGRTWQRVR